MITPKKAAERVKKTQNYEQVIKVRDYDKQHYVVEALPHANKLPHGEQVTFGVDKNTGEVTAFYIENLKHYLATPACEF